MDANGTFHHLLLDKEDWARCLDTNGQPLSLSLQEPRSSDAAHLAWDPDRHELTLEPHIFLYTAAPGDSLNNISQRRGAACDQNGNFYWIDGTQRKVRIRSVGSRTVSDFWPVADLSCAPGPGDAFQPLQAPETPPSLTLSGLAVTEDQYLVVGVLKTDPAVRAGLLVFDLLSGEAPMRFTWPPEVAFAPFDMAPRPGGGVWILDKENKQYWALDRSFSVLAVDSPPEAAADIFQPADNPDDEPKRFEAQSFVLSPENGGGFPIHPGDAALTPISIEALPDCSVLILSQKTSDYSLISHYDGFGNELDEPAVSTKIMELHLETSDLDQAKIISLLTIHDFAFVPNPDPSDKSTWGRLYLASQSGNQAFAFTVKRPFGLEPIFKEGCMLMRLFGGKALLPCSGQVYYDLGERWVPLINQPRLRYDLEETFSRQFDGKQPGCVWHRLMLDACIPPDTQAQVWSRAADDPSALDALPWQLETIYLRGDGSELPFAPDPFHSPTADESGLLQAGNRRVSAEGAGTWELLFQRASGRYLQIRVRLSGQGQRTPRLREMRVYYPRFSYLEHYLPAVYRADDESASFLDRYLANTEGFYTALEDKIATVRQLFDVDSASPEALDWLTGWFGAALHPGWDDARRRLFIRHAALLFQYRGTLPGLQMILRLALDDCPGEHIFQSPVYRDGRGLVRIVEAFLARRFAGVFYGDPTDQPPAADGSAQPGYWQPANGSAELHRRYHAEFETSEPYPLRRPDGSLAQAWMDFSRQQLGFIPAAAQATLLLWQAYLLRTYGAIEKYNLAYGLSGNDQLDSFDEAVPPDELPLDGAPLEDWYRFETTFLPLARNAHHFSVLLPLPADIGPDAPEYRRRLDLATQLVELEKPAHTTCTIKFFWALFRVGEARLGLDTALDADSRSAQLIPALVLGQGYLGQTVMADDAPHGFPDRVALTQGCAPNVGTSMPPNTQKMVVKRYPYAYGCAANS